MYWVKDKNGEKTWKLGECLAAFGCFIILVSCFSTILYYAYNIYRSMKEAQCRMSAKTLKMNRQLFITLTFQTFFPFILMYGPVGLLFTLPIFDINVGRISNFVSATVAIYPSLEQLVAMFCIKAFRSTIMCKQKVESNPSARNS